MHGRPRALILLLVLALVLGLGLGRAAAPGGGDGFGDQPADRDIHTIPRIEVPGDGG